MAVWWESLGLLGQVFACIALPATAIMLAQSLMLIFGFASGGDADADMDVDGDIDADFDFDADADGDFDSELDPNIADGEVDDDLPGGGEKDTGLALFTVRGIVAFFAVGGWVGLLGVRMAWSPYLSVVLAFSTGWGALYVLALIMRWSMKLQSAGNIDRHNAVGKPGNVYLTVPAAGEGDGKVNITLQERFVEMKAISRGGPIPTGTAIVVVAVQGDALVVEPAQADDL